MNARWPNALLCATTLHATVVGAALWLGYGLIERNPLPRPMVLVAAADSFLARTTAPALPSEARSPAVHFAAPVRPALAPVVEEAATVEPDTPVAPRSPARTNPRSAVAGPTANAARDRSATAPRPPRTVAGSRSTTTPAVTHIDATTFTQSLRDEGARGVATAGRDGADQSYRALLENALRAALERVPGLNDGLSAEAEFQLTPAGCAIHPRLVRASGDPRFDAAILSAIIALELPAPPAGFAPVQRVPFATHARQ